MNLIIADDHHIFRKGLVSLVEQIFPEASVREAINGKETISQVKEDPPDIILMDLEMPEMDGIDATTYLNKHFPDVKILVLTMHENHKFIIQMIKLGVCSYMLKGCDEEEVETAIRSVYEDGYYFSKRMTDAMRKELTSQGKFKHEFRESSDLTAREREILLLICKEYTNKEIAQHLSLSTRTVDGHRNRLLEKCNAKNTAGLIIYAIKNGLVDVYE